MFYLSRKQPGSSQEPPTPGPPARPVADGDLYRYSFEDRSEKQLKSALVDISPSADRKKLLLVLGESHLEVADASEKLDSKPVDLAGLRMLVDPRLEWQQIFDEVWRMEQAYFYDPNMHGLDWRAVRARYEPLLQFVQRREDLNELLVEMIGELQVGHNRVGAAIFTRRSRQASACSAPTSKWSRATTAYRRFIAATAGIRSSCPRSRQLA